MEILLVSYGSTGDVRPLLALGLALRERGAHVRVCAPPDSRPLFRAAGISYSSLGGNVRQLMDAKADRFVGRPLAAMAPMTRALRQELAIQFRRLPEAVKSADMVIGSGLALAVPSVAEACGVPYRYAFSIPALLPSRDHAPVTVPWQNLPPLCNRVLWRLADSLLDLGYRFILNGYRRGLGLPVLDHVMPHLTANLIVAADKELAPLPPEAPSDCRQTGYWHAPRKDPLPAAIEAFLDKGPLPIYIGFGSMGDPTPRQTVSKLRQAVGLAGVRAIIQSGWAGWSFESDGDCLCVAGDLPHERLFSRVAGVVHHGGAGTVMAAARAGVPQVIIPHLLDQYYWGQRIVTLGIGPPPLPINRLNVQTLARALRRMLTSPGMRARARTLARPLCRRDGAREAARWIMTHPPAAMPFIP
jgi:UDP:flavonoid glycosyltransferase YjiC (YdhE family)